MSGDVYSCGAAQKDRRSDRTKVVLCEKSPVNAGQAKSGIAWITIVPKFRRKSTWPASMTAKRYYNSTTVTYSAGSLSLKLSNMTVKALRGSFQNQRIANEEARLAFS